MGEELEYVQLELSILQKQREDIQHGMMLSEAFPGPLDEERRQELNGVELQIITVQRRLDELALA